MGLLQGPMSLRFYRVDGELPRKSPERVLEPIRRHAFRELGPEKETGMGWVSPANLLDTDFDEQKVFSNQYLTLSLRVDKKQIDARLFRARLEKEMEAVQKKTRRERLRPAERKEIRQKLQRELLAQTDPARRVYDLCWDVGTGRLYYYSTADATQDPFRNLFQKTFDLEVEALSVKGRFEAAIGGPIPPDVEDPGREFLTWLFWRTDREGGRFELPKSGEIFLWIEDRLVFKDGGEKPASTAVSGGDPARAPESKAALAGGKRLARVKVGLKRGEREWSLTLDGETLDVTALKIPALFTEREDEVLYERVALLEEAVFAVEELFGQFARARVSGTWERGEQAAIARWIAEAAPGGAVREGEGRPKARRKRPAVGA